MLDFGHEFSLPNFCPSVGPEAENGGLYHFTCIQKSISKVTPGFYVPLPLLITPHANLILALRCLSVAV